ncbi:IS110 family transposase [Leisingera sp. MMG026]|uniref:IS110 family transposase n=1 Tax=Leisingera sp. MMG026 TaxID=2909982 RepID=UPI001F00A7A5|nr:IS110 family transposase [Leisingera sp. MMG026]MCF6429279.1 IS110 family transposase [Leisingera sp. MMG026]
MTVKTLGLDLAKDVFQVHGISETGRKVFNRKIKRARLLAFFESLPSCMAGMEACGSAHHRGSQFRKLRHEVLLMPATYVKPNVKRGKPDAADAEAICEAVRRPAMRFAEIKTEDRQALLSVHRTRGLVVRQRTRAATMIRGLLREFGHVLPTGAGAVTAFAKRHLEGGHPGMPELASGGLGTLCCQLLGLNARIDGFSRLIERHARRDADARRLMQVPGTGPITASAIVAAISDANQFRTGRYLAAWLGFTPLNKTSGGKESLGHITKKGTHCTRKLLIAGMTSRMLMAKRNPEKAGTWTAKMLAGKPVRLAAVAMANKAARASWVMLTRLEDYRQPAA